MKHLSLAIAATATALLFAQPTYGGTGVYGYNHPQPTQRYTAPGQPPKKAKRPGQYNALRAQQLRNECRTYAFRYWRYHPDYQHCRYR